MIEFTPEELQYIESTLEAYKTQTQILGYVPSWLDSIKDRITQAMTVGTRQVLVPKDAYMQRVGATDREMWVLNCRCGYKHVTTVRTGQCPQCGIGFEILKNIEELNV